MPKISKLASVSYNWGRKTYLSLYLMCFKYRIVNSCLIFILMLNFRKLKSKSCV